MTQISYQPAFDAYNAAFRMLRLREVCWSRSSLSFEALRIADFYLIFPFLIDGIRLRREHTKWKKLSDKYASRRPYARTPSPQIIFQRMFPFQLAAFERIVDSDFALLEQWSHGQALASSKPIPDALATEVRELNSQQADLIDTLSELVHSYPLLGAEGLKARTQLQEFRYDAV